MPEAAAYPSSAENTDQKEGTKPKETVRSKVKTLTSSEEDALRKYAKTQKDMNFTFIKLRSTSVRRKEMAEINQLIKERLK